MLLWWWTYVIVYLFKPIECMTSRVIPKVNYGLWLWYVNVSSSSLKIYTILVGNVDNEGGNGHLMWRVDSLEKTLMLGGIGAGGEGETEDEMAGWHHWVDGCEFEWTPGVGDGQGGLAWCDSWGRKESTRLSDWTELNACVAAGDIWYVSVVPR